MRGAPARNDENLELERTSGVFFRSRRVAQAAPCAPHAEDIARAVHSVTRTWAAVLLTPSFRLGATASVFPAPAQRDDSGFSLVMRLSAWLPQAGDSAGALTVPAYVRRWMPVDAALVVPIQTLHTVGWIAVPHTGSTRELVREVEGIASGIALDFDCTERRERIATLSR